MRVYIIVASLALSVIGKASGTVVDTGADAQRSCDLLVVGSFHDDGEARSAGACEGMIETAMYFSPNLLPDVRACPPALGSVLESARVLLRYLDQNPDRLNVPGITLAFEAFRDAWPCQGDDAQPSGRSGPKQKKRVRKKTKKTTLPPSFRRSRRKCVPASHFFAFDPSSTAGNSLKAVVGSFRSP